LRVGLSGAGGSGLFIRSPVDAGGSNAGDTREKGAFRHAGHRSRSIVRWTGKGTNRQ
jgi:hypothetical protein